MRDKEDRLLVEMTDLSADLARDMAARARKAEVREDAERYTRAFDRMIRSMRLSIALRRRLERLDARDEAQRRTEAADLRKARLRASLRDKLGLVPPPQGEVDRDECRETEGVETHPHLSGRQPPHPTTSGAPPDRADALGEQLEAADFRPPPS